MKILDGQHRQEIIEINQKYKNNSSGASGVYYHKKWFRVIFAFGEVFFN